MFTMNVKVFFHNDAMLRQITESVRISHVKEEEPINTRAESNYLPIHSRYQSRTTEVKVNQFMPSLVVKQINVC